MFNIHFDYNLGQKVGEKFTKLSKTSFSMKCFAAAFLHFFLQKTSKLGFWVGGWVSPIKSEHFRDFLEIS